MHLKEVLGALAFALPALAAPAARGTHSRSSTFQVLNYNNLSANNNGTTAVLVHSELSRSDAHAQCASIGERLYPFSSAPQANRTELQYQLDYLVFNQDLPRNASLWVAEKAGQCMAYSYQSKQVVNVPCDSKHPALCTSSVPPTTDKDRTAVPLSNLPFEFDGYSVTGYRDARSFRFLGLPFADPPVDNLRFAPPQPYSGPKQGLDATKYSASCIQSASSFGTLNNEGISEDCLYLNIYTPVLPGQGDQSSSGRPVAVYFYGGAFKQGSASLIEYDGGNFASRNDVIVVTANYRVGALGYMSTGNLTTGSYGTQDQISALKWVNRHIAAFGGDPDQITIFGQSAGGQSVVALLSSSAAKGLFSGAIVQSAPLDLPWYTREVYHEYIAPAIAKAVGCDDDADEKDMLSCLRSVPATNYLDNSTDFKGALDSVSKDVSENYLHTSSLLAGIEPFMPVIDDTDSGVIDDQFNTLLKSSSLPNYVPTMFSTVTDEAYFYVNQQVPELGSTTVGLDIIFSIAYPHDLSTKLVDSGVFPVNKSSPDGTRNAAGDALTYSEWTCPQAHILNLTSTAGKSFPSLYEVEIGQGHPQTTEGVPEICSPNNDYNASCHTSDVLLVWGNLNSKTMAVDPYYSEKDLQHSQMLNDIFGSFFRTHDPNPNVDWLKARGPAYQATLGVFDDDGFEIKEYSSGEKSLSLLNMPPRLMENPGTSDKCAVFTEYGYTFQHANMTG